MERGSIVNKWMLEFALTDLKDDNLVAKMLTSMPLLEDNVGLKRIILLRAIEGEVAEYSVSEKTLDALEIAFELDRQSGFDVLESIKKAYCSVAVDCVIRFAKKVSEEDEYFDAVERIWRKRIGRLRAHNVDLFSEDLEIWTDRIESAVWDNNLRVTFFEKNTRYEAVVDVKRYLVEAWKTVGPIFSSSTLGKSLVEAQLLCLQNISETNKVKALKSFNTPQGLGNDSNPTAQFGGEVPNVPHDPSSLVSNPLLKNKDQEHFLNIPTQNPTCIVYEKGSVATLNLIKDENARLEDIGIIKEQSLLQTSFELTQDNPGNIEPVHDKGGDPNVVKEHLADSPSSAPVANLLYPNNLKAHCEATQKVRARRKHVGCPIKLSKRVRITDSEDVDTEGPNRQQNPLSEVEVIKIREGFKTSSRELQDMVKDPLPDALCVADAVLSNLSGNSVPQSTLAASTSIKETLKSCDVELEKGNDGDSKSYKNNVRTPSMELNTNTNQACGTDPIDVPINETSTVVEGNGNDNIHNDSSGHENRQRRATLWERNASTRTFEWDDSADGSPEVSFNLPTPKNGGNSPLRRYECQKFIRRRQIKRWSVVEEDTLREGVQRYGRGNWKIILNAYRDTFEERTEVDLKDKWRRMTS